MCGLSDVRRRTDGEFVCQVCGKELGVDYADKVRATSGPLYSAILAGIITAPPALQSRAPADAHGRTP